MGVEDFLYQVWEIIFRTLVWDWFIYGYGWLYWLLFGIAAAAANIGVNYLRKRLSCSFEGLGHKLERMAND